MRGHWYKPPCEADNLFERQVHKWKEREAHAVRNILKGILRLGLFNP